MTWRRGDSRALALAVCAAVTIACGRSEQPTPDGAAVIAPAPATTATAHGAPRGRLTPVQVPDMTGAEPGLQERVRARFASLEAVRARGSVADEELAAAFGEVGKLLIAAEFLAEAEPFLTNARLLAPGDATWPYYLAHLHRLRSAPAQAIPFFEQALRLRPDDVPTLVWLGALHVEAGQPSVAEPLLRKAVSLQPRSVAARFGLGRAALAAGDHAGAIEHLEAALTVDPQARPVHYPLAMAYRARGEPRRAEEHLRLWKDGPLYPDDPLLREIGESLQTAVGYEVRGTRALDAQQWTQAAALFRQGLAVAPRDATLHQNLGTALFLAGDAPGALREFEEAARLSPGYAKAEFSIGVLMDASGRDREAVERFSDAVRFDPQMVDARFSLAEVLRRTGQFEAALAHYATIVAADQGASQARFGYAMALVRLRRWDDARAALEAAVKAHGDQPGFPHALARLLAAAPDDRVRDGRRAVSIVEGLQRQYGSSANLLETSAMALAEVGRFKDATTRQREALAAAQQQGRADLAEGLRENLRRYESGMPCRTPWRDDDPVHQPRTSGLVRPR